MHSESHKTRTLWLVGVLHGFTHVYHVALMPLYLLIQKDFKLASASDATLLVTVMMLSYFVPSYFMGVLADRVSRKQLLGWGLLINGLGFAGLALAPGYGAALSCVAVAGLGGSFFHPAATALVARLFPVNTGRALGLIGMGAGIGFFIAPLYSGWRAETAGWRAPVLELGLLGIAAALAFFWLAEEQPVEKAGPAKVESHPMFPTPAVWGFFILAALAFSLRDFTGNSMGTLNSLFLQKAHNFSPQGTGRALSAIFLAAIVSNPLFGSLSDRARLRSTLGVLLMAAVMVAVYPHVGRAWLLPALAAYGFFFMGSYPMVEAALMQAVPDSVRGRVFGLWISIGGLIGNLAHWRVGGWVDGLGTASRKPEGYFNLYAGLATLILVSLLGLPCLHAIRKREEKLPAEIAPPAPTPALK